VFIASHIKIVLTIKCAIKEYVQSVLVIKIVPMAYFVIKENASIAITTISVHMGLFVIMGTVSIVIMIINVVDIKYASKEIAIRAVIICIVPVIKYALLEFVNIASFPQNVPDTVIVPMVNVFSAHRIVNAIVDICASMEVAKEVFMTHMFMELTNNFPVTNYPTYHLSYCIDMF